MSQNSIEEADFVALFARDQGVRQAMLADGSANLFDLRNDLTVALFALEAARFKVLQAHGRLAAHDPFYAERRPQSGAFETALIALGQTVLAARTFDYDGHPMAPKLIENFEVLESAVADAVADRANWRRGSGVPGISASARYSCGEFGASIIANLNYPGWFWRVYGSGGRTLDSCNKVGRFYAGSAVEARDLVEQIIGERAPAAPADGGKELVP